MTDTQLKKLKTAVKNKTGTTRQKTKWRNAFNNILSTDLKLTRAQIFKIIKSGGILGSLLNKLAGPLMKVAIPLAKNVLAPLGITTASSAIDAGIQKKKKKKKIHGSLEIQLFNNFNRRNKLCNENCSNSWRFYFTKRNH